MGLSANWLGLRLKPTEERRRILVQVQVGPLKVVIASMLNRVDLNKLGHVELILDEALSFKVARL